VSLYDAGKYEECAGTLGKLLDPAGPRPLEERAIVERARLYHAACLIGAGRPELADQPLRDAIRANPQMRAPDSLVFPGALIDRFVRVQESMVEEIRAAQEALLRKAEQERAIEIRRERAERARLMQLELLAAQETVVTRRQRWIAAVPYGVGQFQNGDTTLGWLFLGTEALLTGVVIGGIAVEIENYTKQGDPELDPADIERNAKTARDVWVTALYALIAVAGGGILQAELAFKPESVGVRPRPLPPHLRSKPTPRGGLELVPSGNLSSRALGLDAVIRF
jgi:hypothetical protein